MFLLAPSWIKRNRKSAHFVAALRRGRLKECNQTRPLSFFGGGGGSWGWTCYLLISNLETNPTAPLIIWSLNFRESVRNQVPIRERVKQVLKSWSRLVKSVTNHRAYLTSCTNSGIETGIKIRADLSFGCRFIFETFAFRSANHMSPIQVSPLTPPFPSTDDKPSLV